MSKFFWIFAVFLLFSCQKNEKKKDTIRIIISVPKGRELAPKTDNPRLGIKDGISILGTSGIVIPFSTASYAASIRQNLDVAIAAGNETVVLTMYW